ncbi:hypothetical protein DL96DRAFT_1586944, partial [Flagelloscypha sp. PMI_526]
PVSFLIAQTKSNIQFLASQSALDTSDADAILLLLTKATAKTTAPGAFAFIFLGSSGIPGSLQTASPTTTDTRRRHCGHTNEKGENTHDLSFNAGDIIQVISEVNQEWSSGCTLEHPAPGLFPTAYAEKLPSSGSNNSPRSAPAGLSTIPEFPDKHPSRPRPASIASTSPATMTLTGGFGSKIGQGYLREQRISVIGLAPSGNGPPQPDPQPEKYTLYETAPPPKTNPATHGKHTSALF